LGVSVEIIMYKVNVVERIELGGIAIDCWLSTLIHEMVHAFLHLYVCRDSECHTEYFVLLSVMGISGHEVPWVEIATVIERVCWSR
jgi:hypothetical protein